MPVVQPDLVERVSQRRAAGKLLFSFLCLVCIGTAVLTLTVGGINPAGVVTAVLMLALAAACFWRAWFARRGPRLDPWRDPEPAPLTDDPSHDRSL